MKRSGPPVRKTAMKRSAPKVKARKEHQRQRRQTGGFSDEVKMQARRRSKGVCEAGSSQCTGKAAHFHHRKLRRHNDHRLVNTLHVCSHCHAYIHDIAPIVAYAMGWLVNSWLEPGEVPVKHGDRWHEFH